MRGAAQKRSASNITRPGSKTERDSPLNPHYRSDQAHLRLLRDLKSLDQSAIRPLTRGVVA